MNRFCISRGVAGRSDPLRCWWDKYSLWEIVLAPERTAISHRLVSIHDTMKDAEKAMTIAKALAPPPPPSEKPRRPRPGEGWRGIDRVRLHKARSF